MWQDRNNRTKHHLKFAVLVQGHLCLETYFGLEQDTLHQGTSIVRSTVRQYKVSILLIPGLEFLFPSSSGVDCGGSAAGKGSCLEDESLGTGAIPDIPSVGAKREAEILPACDGGPCISCFSG